jgi:signal transduction histidine kinase
VAVAALLAIRGGGLIGARGGDMTTDSRSTAIVAIETAVAHPADALDELDRMPTGDKTTIGFVAHALDNCLSVADATLDLLAHALRDHPDTEVTTWVAGLRHLGDLMQHTMGRLVVPPPADFPLRNERIDLPKLIARVCHYHASAAERKRLAILCRPIGDIPPAWGDRVALAVVADNLLSNAVNCSRPDGNIVVQVFTGPGGVVCSVRDNRPGLDAIEQAQLFQRGARAGPTPSAGDAPADYGLSIARELMDRMGGQLWFESESRDGVCFSFRIPYPPPDTAPG